jgi:hypothetical protein
MNVISRFGKFMQTKVIRLRMKLAALYLFRDYKNDPELTAFAALDGDEFFEYEIQ